MARKEKSEYIIQAVSHALDLLEQFHDEVDELGRYRAQQTSKAT
jgi:hypothetical protein